jgi:hypothetical protein
MKTKKAQMQMSVGTIVTIVLLMTVLILGLVLVRSIFSGAIENIDSVDQAVKNEINKLFAEDDARKVVVYPSSRLVKIKKGDDALRGFAFSIRNVETEEGDFTYTVGVNDPDIRSKCNINVQEAERWIKAGGSGSLTIPPGSLMDNPEFVRYSIPENAPPCIIRYGIDVKKDGQQYNPTLSVDLEIKSS